MALEKLHIQKKNTLPLSSYQKTYLRQIVDVNIRTKTINFLEVKKGKSL